MRKHASTQPRPSQVGCSSVYPTTSDPVWQSANRGRRAIAHQVASIQVYKFVGARHEGCISTWNGRDHGITRVKDQPNYLPSTRDGNVKSVGVSNEAHLATVVTANEGSDHHIAFLALVIVNCDIWARCTAWISSGLGSNQPFQDGTRARYHFARGQNMQLLSATWCETLTALNMAVKELVYREDGRAERKP